MTSSSHPRREPFRPTKAAFTFAAAVTFAFLLGACTSAEAPSTPPDGRTATGDGQEASGSESPDPPPPVTSKSMPEALDEVYAKAAKSADEGADQADREHRIQYPEPPDGRWLTDDSGSQYFLEEIPKEGRRFRRLEGDRIRMRYGVTYDVARETEEAFFVKIYKVEPVERKKDPGPTPEEIARVEESFKAPTATAQELRFQDFGSGLPSRGQWRNGFDLADMNGDGHLDVVHGPPRRGFSGPIIYLGDGAGGWRHWEVEFPRAPYGYGDAEAADFDGDGHVDLALGVHLGGITALRNDGQGGFELWADGLDLRPQGQATSDIFLSRAITSADWDGDGRPDLAALSEGPRHPKSTDRGEVETPPGLVIHRNVGDGSWEKAIHLGAEVGLFGDSIASGDFDGDGRPDLATGSNALGRRGLVFLNRDGGEPEPIQLESLRRRAYVWSVATADFDGDGLDDLAMAVTSRQVEQWWTAVDVLLARRNDEGLTFERRTVAGGHDTLEARVTALGAGDLDADGHADLVGATGAGEVRVWRGDGRGGFTFQQAELTPAVEGCRGYHVQLADLDSDGSDEAVVALAGEQCPGGGSLRAWKASPD